MTTTSIPSIKYPGQTSRAIDASGKKLTGDWGNWTQGIHRAVLRLLDGVNGGSADAAQAEADAQTGIANAAAAQATADAALPKAGGTMTGPIVFTPYTVATLPTATAYSEAWISDGSTAYPTNAGAAPTGGGTNKRKVFALGTIPGWKLF